MSSDRLRPYQQQAAASVTRGWLEYRRQLACMATGAGKTVFFSHLAAQEPGRTLILVHRQELARQAAGKLFAATGLHAAVEMGEERAVPGHKVVIGSVQSMRSRLGKYAPDAFDLIICDEAHHSISPEWQAVLSHFAGARVLGVTATPSRSDKRALGSYYEHVAAEVSLLQLIKEGFLCPIRARKLDVEIDVSALRKKRGYLSAGDVGGALGPRVEALAAAAAEELWDRKAVVFLPLCHTSESFAAALCRHGINARHVAGDSADRDAVLSWFAEPGRKTLCNAMLLTEGWDCPEVDCVMPLRATGSESLYIQMAGRMTRLFPGKEFGLLLDPLWITGAHSLCRPADICASGSLHRDALQARLDLGEDLLAAEEQAQRIVADTLERQLKEAKKKKAPRGTVDPVAWALALHDGDLAQWEPDTDTDREPVTAGQLVDLRKLGLWTEGETMCRGYAAALLDRAETRAAMGLASPRQVALCKQMGHANAELLSAGEAGLFISRKSFRRRGAA